MNPDNPEPHPAAWWALPGCRHAGRRTIGLRARPLIVGGAVVGT